MQRAPLRQGQVATRQRTEAVVQAGENWMCDAVQLNRFGFACGAKMMASNLENRPCAP